MEAHEASWVGVRRSLLLYSLGHEADLFLVWAAVESRWRGPHH